MAVINNVSYNKISCGIIVVDEELFAILLIFLIMELRTVLMCSYNYLSHVLT